jgi:hypothetical protein
MRKPARRDSARAWIESGAVVTLKVYAKRYGVDKYTAYEDLAALGFPLGQREAHWAPRPLPTPRRREPELSIGSDIEWIRYGDEIMFVVGTPRRRPVRLCPNCRRVRGRVSIPG